MPTIVFTESESFSWSAHMEGWDGADLIGTPLAMPAFFPLSDGYFPISVTLIAWARKAYPGFAVSVRRSRAWQAIPSHDRADWMRDERDYFDSIEPWGALMPLARSNYRRECERLKAGAFYLIPA